MPQEREFEKDQQAAFDFLLPLINGALSRHGYDAVEVTIELMIEMKLADLLRAKAENEAMKAVAEAAKRRQWLCELRPDDEAESKNQASMILVANQALNDALINLDALNPEPTKEKKS